MKKNNYSRVCIVGTVYTLFFYLLNCNDDEIESTFFFFGDGIPLSVREKFNHYFYFKRSKKLWRRRLSRIFLNFFSHVRWPFLNSAKLFGQDHLWFSSGIIGKREYVLLEDAPFIMSLYFNSVVRKNEISNRSGLKGLFNYLLFGNLFQRSQGENNQCKEVILSQKDNSSILQDKIIHVKPLEELWELSSGSKKEKILSVFGISKEDIVYFKNKSVILFTQPFSVDNYIDEQEQVNLYRDILKSYDKNEVLLKVHPRDDIDYRKYFSDIAVFNKPVPMQLFDVIGVKFNKAVTVCSTAVFSFSYDIEIDWIGTQCNKHLYEIMGDIKMPEKNNK
jgi:hypothetical protein